MAKRNGRDQREADDENLYNLDAFDDEDDDEDDEDEELDDGNDGDDESSDGDDDDLDPRLAARLEKERKRLEDEIVAQIARGDTKSPIYKGLQQVVDRKDKQIRRQEQVITGLVSKVQELDSTLGDTSEVMKFIGGLQFDQLTDEERAAASSKLAALQEKRKNEALAARLERLERGGGRQAPPAGESADDLTYEDLDPQIKSRIEKFVDGRKKAAEKAGVSPDDPALDYGNWDEGLPERLEKFEESLDALVAKKKAERLNRVRRTEPEPRTRFSGGGDDGGSVAARGQSLLERGAATWFSEQRMRDKPRRNR